MRKKEGKRLNKEGQTFRPFNFDTSLSVSYGAEEQSDAFFTEPPFFRSFKRRGFFSLIKNILEY